MVAVPPAHSDQVSHARIVRLSFVEGDVAYQRPGSTWQRAMINLPIQQDFSLRTDAGYAEVEFETGLMIRLAQNTRVEFTELSLIDGGKVTSLKLDQGTIIATANLSRNDQLSIAAGNLRVAVPRSGRFRMDASDSQNYVTVLHGKVDVVNGTTTTELDSGKSLHFGAAENALSVDRSPRPDAFDKWVAQRDEAQQTAQSDAGDFVSQRDYPFTLCDLYDYGLWYNIPGYGMAWQPYGLGPGWMPFANGMWMFDGLDMDWMWMSFEPWGWMPYHYGGWVDLAGGGWFWIPQNLGVFQGATAGFVNVGNQVGWTPNLATPTKPGKVKAHMSPTTQVVFAGRASNGVITAGPRGQLTSSATFTSGSKPASSFVQQGAPILTNLIASGVRVTSRGPSMNTALTYTPHGTMGANIRGQASLNAPVGRPMVMAPHSSPAPVMRAPSTFAGSFSGGRNSGFTAANSGAPAGGSHGASGSASGSSANSGAHSAGASGAPGSPAGGSASGKH